MNKKDRINILLGQYRQIVDSERNRQCRRLWKQTRSIILDKWRGCPETIAKINQAPVCVWLGTDILHEFLGLDLVRYYTEPLYFLEKWLEVKIFHFQNFPDDNYYDSFIPLWLGEGFEATLFGMKMRYLTDKDPSIDRTDPVINDQTDLDAIPQPGFHTAGIMPLAIRFYEEILETVKDFGLDVGFVNWGNGPQMTCNYLHGFENMCAGFLVNPEFVRKLLERVTMFRMEWTRQRSKYLGQPVPMGEILDDDASVPNLSPDIFEEFIFPCEKRLAEFHRGISYWHDCGPADPYLDSVKRLGTIELMNSGPFSDHRLIAEYFAKQSAIEHHVKPRDEGVNADPGALKHLFHEIKNLYRVHGALAYTVRLTAYRNPRQTIQQDIETTQKWVRLATETFHKL